MSALAALRAQLARVLTRPTLALLRAIDPYATVSYAQEAEDLVVLRALGGRAEGFYVDVGAHHPARFSNTLLLYRRGWHGINIDPDPEAMRLFATQRPRDVNLAIGISDAPATLAFHRFNEPALNTFDAELARERQTLPGYRLMETRQIPVRRLDEVLGEHLPSGQGIDLLSVDAEGYDYRVLASNDWKRFRPRLAVVEALQSTLESVGTTPVHGLLSEHGYELFAKTVNSLFYRDRNAR